MTVASKIEYIREQLKTRSPELSAPKIKAMSADALSGMMQVFQVAGGDIQNPNTNTTPVRYLAALMEMTEGYNVNPKQYLDVTFTQEEGLVYDEMILSAGIPFVSLCEHHMLPFFGEVHVAYIPQKNAIVGLSKLARLVDGYAKRFQVQEQLTVQIRQAMDEKLQPLGAATIIQATHTCQCFRGVKKDGRMLTSSLSGVFRDDANNARTELFKMLDLVKK